MHIISRALIAGVCLAAFVASPVMAQQEPPRLVVGDLEIAAHGSFTYGGVAFGIGHFGSAWQFTSQKWAAKPNDGSPAISEKAWELHGQFGPAAGGLFDLHQTIHASGAKAFRYEAALHNADGIETLSLALHGDLPISAYGGKSLLVDGREVPLPTKQSAMEIFSASDVKRLVIPCSRGRLMIEGPMRVYVQDDRQFGTQAFNLRLAFDPSSGRITQSSLKLGFKLEGYDSHPIDLRSLANAGLDGADGAAQLRDLPPGRQRFGGLDFDVIDPASNGGLAIVMLAPGGEKQARHDLALPISDGLRCKNLYFLHANSGAPKSGVGGVATIEYADGTKQRVKFTVGRDVGGMRTPRSFPNAPVLWTAETPDGYVGLYATRVRLDHADRPLRRVTLEAGAAAWAIVAITASNDEVPLSPAEPTMFVADHDWQPIGHSLDVEAGGALDFSFLLDAPAGKHGRVLVRGPHFEFADRRGQRVRFYGANLCFTANFPNKAQAERLAARLARLGYNSVRLHHYDWDLTDKNAADSVTLDPAQLDRIDYLWHCLKEKGIYLTIDLYTFRETRAGEIPELNRPVRSGYKAAVYLLDSAMENWKVFATHVMTHRNPYTGLTWAEDPALIGICPLNEDPLVVNYNEGDDLRRLYDQRFDDWSKRAKFDAGPAARDAAYSRFLAELQMAGNRKLFAHLKSLGVTAPLTGVNCINDPALTPVRQELEYVDNHAYWDHPGFPERPWSLPHSYSNQSATAALAAVPRGMFPTRIAGKPFTVTEVNYCLPNRYRAEGGPLMGAYAALQDWDGVWRFAYAHSIENADELRPAGGFDLATDPLNAHSERIAMLMFLRGDVSPARQEREFVVMPSQAFVKPGGWSASFPDEFSKQGLVSRLSSRYREKESDDQPQADAVPERFVSDTSELAISSRDGTFDAVTSRTECFIFTSGRTARGGRVTVRGDGGFQVVSVSALDDQPIANSRRLLVLHLTDVQNTKTRFRDAGMTLLESWGQLPHLVRRGRAELTLKVGGGGWKGYALDARGQRSAPLKLEEAPDGLRFAAETIAAERTRLAYELVRE